jgi:hypothetical protein
MTSLTDEGTFFLGGTFFIVALGLAIARNSCCRQQWRFVCCRRQQWRSVLGKQRQNAAISNEKELVNLIS